MHRFLAPVIAPIFALCLTLLPATAQDLFTGPNPNWVTVTDLPEPTPALLDQATGGVLFLLSDEQVAWQGDEKLTYFRAATLVTDRYGLESAATLQFVFDPAFESLTLTRVAVIRDGQVIDHTETVQADILRREMQLEDGILDGNLTALLQVPDLRVGDVIDYSFLRRTLPIIDVANRSGTAYMEYDVPVVLARVAIDWPESWPIYISGWPERVEYVQTPGEGTIRHVWTRRDHIPVKTEEMTPPGYRESVTIEYTALPDWSGIAAAISDHYLTSYPLGPEWDAKLRSIQADYATDGERVMAALRAVQDEMRYVSLSIGDGGLLARLPAVATASGFGDCKDKALLLRTMLDKMGIEAYVALTDLDEGHGLIDRKPALWSFDHAIVKVIVDEGTYWMDPTASHEGGDIYLAAVPDYGYALPLTGPNQQQLEPIDVSYTSVWSSFVDEVYDFSLLGVYFTVTTNWDGPAANSFRQDLGGSSRTLISQDYLEYYAGRYPGIRLLAPIEVTDDRVANRMTVVERYLIPTPALYENGLREDFEFAAQNYTEGLPQAMGPRMAPLDLGAPSNYFHRVSVYDAPIDFTLPDPASIYNDAFSFNLYAYGGESPGDMVLEWSYSATNRVIAPDAVAQVLQDAAIVADNAWFTWDLRP
jgi:transglutaminase-like putative cysteine protease